MKLDAKTIAALELGDKTDAIWFDEILRGFGYRWRIGANGKHLRSWIVQYRHAGNARRYLIGSAEVLTAERARAAAKEILAKITLGQDPQGDRTERREKDRDRFDAVVKLFLAAKERSVRPRTLFQLKRYLADADYCKAFHAKPLDRITRKDVAARITSIELESGPAQAREVRSTLSSFFAWAMRQGLCEANPVIATDRPKTKSRDRVLSDDELAAIWNACRDDEYGKIIRLLILTGCRRSEIGDIAFSEIDLDKGTWTLPAERSKNHRAHTLPVMPMMRAIIDTVPQMASRDQLFGRRGSGFTAWSWKECKPALDARSGVKDWTVHDIRRSVVTKMADIGVLPHVIEAVINHYSGHRAGIASIYNKSPYTKEVRNALAMWHDHLRTLIAGGERRVLNFASETVG